MAGLTYSTDLPTVNAFQSSLSGTMDAYLLKLNASGNALLYSSYFGGSGTNEAANEVVLDSSGMVYIAGHTQSTDLPLKNALDSSLSGTQDAFVAKFDLAQTGSNSLLYSTYFGGSGYDSAARPGRRFGRQLLHVRIHAIPPTLRPSMPTIRHTTAATTFSCRSSTAPAAPCCTRRTWAAPVATTTTAWPWTIPETPISRAEQRPDSPPPREPMTLPITAAVTIRVVAKFDTTLSGASSLIYSTYLGGGGWDMAYDLDIDSVGNVYVTGATASLNHPTTADGNDRIRSGSFDGFLTVLDANGANLVYSTYLGGSVNNRG